MATSATSLGRATFEPFMSCPLQCFLVRSNVHSSTIITLCFDLQLSLISTFNLLISGGLLLWFVAHTHTAIKCHSQNINQKLSKYINTNRNVPWFHAFDGWWQVQTKEVFWRSNGLVSHVLGPIYHYARKHQSRDQTSQVASQSKKCQSNQEW